MNRNYVPEVRLAAFFSRHLLTLHYIACILSDKSIFLFPEVYFYTIAKVDIAKNEDL